MYKTNLFMFVSPNLHLFVFPLFHSSVTISSLCLIIMLKTACLTFIFFGHMNNNTNNNSVNAVQRCSFLNQKGAIVIDFAWR